MSPERQPKVKLDENLGRRGEQLLRGAGWDVETVTTQDLCAASDATLIEVCRAEGRALISFDKDFANTVRFSPERYDGIVVLRLPGPISLDDVDNALRRMLKLAETRRLAGRLWVIDHIRIREFSVSDPDE